MKLDEWKVDVSGELNSSLERCLEGPPRTADGKFKLEEKLIDRIGGVKIEIFANEHPPPHFRVLYAGETANYRIKDCQQINGKLGEHYWTIYNWFLENKQKLIDTWNNMRPDNCPVGKYIE